MAKKKFGQRTKVYEAQKSRTEVNKKCKLERYIRQNPNDNIAVMAYDKKVSESRFSQKKWN